MNAGPIKTLGYLNPPWQPTYGYAHVEKIGDHVHIAGQMSHDTAGNLVGPAPVDANGLPTDYSNMALQLRVAYANASKLLALLGGSLDDVIEETLYVANLGAAIHVIGAARKQAYSNPWPSCKSRLVKAPRLLFPEQLVEIALTADLSIHAAHLGSIQRPQHLGEN
ncbi:RidA family protein [Stutzerimonas nitrititolerans]|uniref:RidA family protein n=1 Tax=Stutzerimonas nitrititolerans TaxID=2482751 RepID=UPI00289CDA8C|nr:Rid family hydrolase [Stutzerimonas nitrititolerans]